MKAIIVLCIIAAVNFFLMFCPLLHGAVAWVGFWPLMLITTGLLAAFAMLIDREHRSSLFAFRFVHIWIGIGSAILLYILTYILHLLLIHVFSPGVTQVRDLYSINTGSSLIAIALLLFFWTGPAAEIFWRGFVQRRLSTRFGPMKGYLLAIGVYTLVHAFSLNFMFIAMALLCGAYWGLIFKRSKSLWPVMISHAIWDVAILVILPLQ